MRPSPRLTRRTRLTGAIGTVALAAALGGPMSRPAGAAQAVIVRGTDAVAAVRRHHGTVTHDLSIIDAVGADIPATELPGLLADRSVRVSPDGAVHLSGLLPGSTYDPIAEPGSMWNVNDGTGSRAVQAWGVTGTGVDVAVVDSGVNPQSAALNGPGKVVAGIDVSGEGNPLSDGVGHGTHMAGIIAGNQGRRYESRGYRGMAPGAHIVSVKVADTAGHTRQAEIVEGLGWVLNHRNTDGHNIRVVNLSLAAPLYSSYTADPVAEAAEVLWQNGIVVVASAGNNADHGLASPAYDPYVIAVGASTDNGTTTPADDGIAPFSSFETDVSKRSPDVVAPGHSIQGPAAPGSEAATHTGPLGTSGFVRGSGTSQAAAVTSGAVALMLQYDPSLSPDQVKAVLAANAVPLTGVDPALQGHGRIRVDAALGSALPDGFAPQSFPPAHADYATPMDPNGPVTGVDPLLVGGSFAGSTWTGSSWTGSTWTGSTWTGSTWTGSSWTGSSWTGSSWTGSSWTGSWD